MKAAYPQAKVLNVKVAVGEWANGNYDAITGNVDDIEINGITYDFEEEEEEDAEAKYYLDQASAYLVEGDFSLAARNLAAARNILGRVKGLLNSMVKVHKVTRTERFIRQFEHRIEGIEDKVERLRGRLGESGTDNMMASMGLAKGKIHQLGEDLSEDNLEDVIDELEITTESIDEDLEELDGDDISPILMTIDRLEAKIRVLKASAERLSGKGYDTDAVVDELEKAEALLKDIVDLLELEEGETDEAEGLLEDAEGFVSEASSMIRGIRKEQQNKGSKDKGKG